MGHQCLPTAECRPSASKRPRASLSSAAGAFLFGPWWSTCGGERFGGCGGGGWRSWVLAHHQPPSYTGSTFQKCACCKRGGREGGFGLSLSFSASAVPCTLHSDT